MIEQFYAGGLGLIGSPWWTALVWPVLWSLIKIVVVLAPLMGCVAYLTLWERKAIAFTQLRQGPNRVGPKGLLTPIADALKLLTKEIILPTAASKGLFVLGPVMAIMPALAAWVAIPFGETTNVRRTSPRSLSSRMTSPASIVLPRPTSSASR